MITLCRSCKSSEIEKVLTLGNFALPAVVLSQDRYNDSKYPLVLMRCVECSLVQLSQSVPKKLLYTEDYGYRSGINKTMKNELSEIVESIEALIELPKGAIVIDIGSNDATLIKNYSKKSIIKVGFDPVAKFASEYNQINQVFINNYFNKKDFRKRFVSQKAHVITAISMFYDIEDPSLFISDIVDCLDKSGVLVIQQNYLLSMLNENAFDNIVHEHLEYYSLYSLERLLERYGLEVFDVIENSLNGGSFRTYIGFKDAKWRKNQRVQNLRDKELNSGLITKSPYEAFSQRIKQLRMKTLEFIKKEIKKNKRFYVYGASTRGNTILQYYGLNSKYILAAVERNPEKWGKIIASSGIPIISEEQARLDMPDYMLVLPWFFKKEFLEREKEYMRLGGKLVFPLSDLEVIGI